MSVWLSKRFCVFLTPIFTIIFLLSASYVVLAQAGQAELTGEVRDSSGAGVPKAAIIVTQIETGEITKTISAQNGVYTVTNLRPGLYTVTVEAQGFRRFLQAGVRLTTGERIRLDLPLSAGEIN